MAMIIGVVGVVLGVVVLVVDDTKHVATYLGAFTMIVIGLGVVATLLRARSR